MEEARVAVVIEDEEDIRSLLSAVLSQAGFAVHGAANGQDGLELVREHQPLVTTLDVNMPGMDGFETAKRIRAISSTYIVMLSARTEEIDALQGLEAGADDYVAKPFRPRELRARIDAMLRRPRHHIAAPGRDAARRRRRADVVGWLEHQGVRLNAETRIVTVDGADLELTRSEFDILADLLDGRPPRARRSPTSRSCCAASSTPGSSTSATATPAPSRCTSPTSAASSASRPRARAGSRPCAASGTG